MQAPPSPRSSTPSPWRPPLASTLLRSWAGLPDPGARQAALSDHLGSLARQGVPIGPRCAHLEALLTDPELARADPEVPATLRLGLAWNLRAAGELRRARNLAADLVAPRLGRGPTAYRAMLLVRILDIGLGLGSQLAGLSLGSLAPEVQVWAQLQLAEASLRVGRHEAAAVHLAQAQRRRRRQEVSGAAVAAGRLRASLALLRGEVDGAADLLAELAETTPSRGPAAWRLGLLVARQAAAAGDLDKARDQLDAVQAPLEALGEQRPLHEARLLRLRLDLHEAPCPEEVLLRGLGTTCRDEDLTDRWRLAALALPHAETPRLRRRLIGWLRDPAGAADRRRDQLRSLLHARTAAARGQATRAYRRLARLEHPPSADTPERELLRLRQQLEGRLGGLPGDRRQDRERRRQRRRVAAASRRALPLPPTSPPPRWCLISPEGQRWLDSLERDQARQEGGDLFVDLEARRLEVAGRTLDFTRRSRPLRLLRCLAEAGTAGCTLADLLETVWERPRVPYETDQLVHSAVHRLRKELGDAAWIQVQDGRYRLAPDRRWRALLGAPPALPSAAAAAAPRITM